MAKAVGQGDAMRSILVAERWRDSPQVRQCLEDRLHAKAAVAPGTTTDSAWAGPLAEHGIAREVLTLVRDRSIIGTVENKFRRVPFRTIVAREIGSGSGGAWIGEGFSTPTAALEHDVITQEAYKAQTAVVLTKELLKFSDPSAERAVRESVAAGVAAFLDGQFLDSTVALSANVSPASITNGASAIVSTGSTAAAINADLSDMLAAITTNGAGLTWIMRPMTAYKIAATIGGTAAADIPRTLFGIPLVLSATSPAQVTLVDCAQILFSDDGGLEVDVTDDATIQMDSAPTDPAVAGTVFQSLWQNDLWAVRVTRWIAWLRAQDGSVAYMLVSY